MEGGYYIIMLAVDTVRLCYNAPPLSGACTFINSQLHDMKGFFLHQSVSDEFL